MTETYKANSDNLFDIKKGDIILYNTVHKQSVLKRTGQALPFDVKKEKAFFTFIPSSTYQINETIHLTSAQDLEIVGGKGYRAPGKRFKVAAYQPMKIVDVRLNIPQGRSKKSSYHYVAEVGDYQYKISDEKLIALTEFYWFISSSGKVEKDIKGRDVTVETFRQKVKNIYVDSKSANDALVKILK